MRVAVVSCAAYRDCWEPFVVLFRKFWPDCPYPLWLVTDEGTDPNYGNVFALPGPGANSWCRRIAEFASHSNEPILFFLEDFFLTGPAYPAFIQNGLELLQETAAGCVRLYPCPGPDGDLEYPLSLGYPHFGLVALEAPYRISTMPAIWRPSYLRDVALAVNGNAWDFEVKGTPLSRKLSDPVLAFKREVQPWPVEVMATGIWRGEWTRGAIKLFAEHSISIDSNRPIFRG